MRAFLRLSLSLYHTLHRSLTLFITLSLHQVHSLIVLFLGGGFLQKEFPSETAARFRFCTGRGGDRLLLASKSPPHQLSRGVSVSGMAETERSSLTMGVSPTELGAFKHDDSYFRASRGGSLPTAPSPGRWNLGASVGGAVNHDLLLCAGEVICCKPSQWEMI